MEATFSGAQLDRASGTLGAPRHKIGALAALLFGIAVRGLTTDVMLEMLTGQLAYVGCFRRPLLAARGHVFRQVSPDGRRETLFRFHSWARNELMCLAFLLPLAVTNLRIRFSNKLYGADASLDAAGGTRIRVSTTMVQELWRRSPRKGQYGHC